MIHVALNGNDFADKFLFYCLQGELESRIAPEHVSYLKRYVSLLADRLLVLYNENLEIDGTPEVVFQHAQELVDMGLDIPEITRVFLKLQSLGLDIPQVYTVEQALRVLNSLKEGNADA